jgi:energy-coupling factor transporter ATP-binding protein EcfA2
MEDFAHPSDDLNDPLPPEPQALLDRFKAYAVWHPRLLQVRTQVLDTIWEPADVAFVVVCGPSGVGKSKLAEVLTRRLNTPKPELNGHIPRRALLINTRPPDGALFHRTDFYQKGLALLGKTTFDRRIKVDVTTAEHMVEKKRPKGKATGYPDNPEVRDAYEEELRLQALRTVILDEAQHLIQSGDDKQPKDQLNWIKSMTTETGVLHVLIGTYDLLPFCNLDGQMARRGSEFHFARYHMEDENDCQAFRNAFLSLLKQIPLNVDHDSLMQRWWYFFEGSIGCIGILKQWLVRALYRALREESAELTRAHLEQSVLPDAKWERMRADARSGEAEFQYANGQNSYLSNLASMPTFVPRQPDPVSPSPSTPSPEDGTADQKTRKPKGRVGEPSPRRDQVGTGQPEGEVAHCSFSGQIELEAARWLESTVQEVQCPTCGSVSKAKLKEQSVVIAQHPPRKSRPVRNVTRWVEQETQWVLIQKKE